jgi:hypothetical protein
VCSLARGGRLALNGPDRRQGDALKTGMDEGDWEILVSRIRAATCTPFLGAGASAHVLPTGTTLADRWADEEGYPLPERGDLARVAQYMALTRDDLYAKELASKLCSAVDPANDLQAGDSYDIIAGLDLPIYVTTNYDDLLLHALRNRGKEPEALLCPWQTSLRESAEQTYTYEPTPKRPVVYFLHGRAHEPGSLVLTEDDYLDFIVWVTRHWTTQSDLSLVSPAVRKALAQTSLLFIGYSQSDWSFRVLMRSIKQAGIRSTRALSVAVQLSPLAADATPEDQEKVSRYLTQYFSGIQDTPVKLYWGTADDFLAELKGRLGT